MEPNKYNKPVTNWLRKLELSTLKDPNCWLKNDFLLQNRVAVISGEYVQYRSVVCTEGLHWIVDKDERRQIRVTTVDRGLVLIENHLVDLL